jgi:isopenicillin-N epimerase
MAMGTTVEGVDVDWAGRRELFTLDPAVAHLNHGGFGAVPRPVQRAQQRLRDELEANPTAFITRGLLDRVGHTRNHLARFVGAPGDGVALVPNATAAATVVLGSVHLEAGQEILVTDHGYGAVRLAAEEFAGRVGASVREVHIPLLADDAEVVQRLVDALRPGRTRMVVVDHVASPTAKLFPVDLLARELRAHDALVLVDAAHGPGMLDIDLAGSGHDADFWLGNLHKWAFTPRPTGLLWAAPAHRADIRPLSVSWEHPRGFPTALEFAGTLDYTAWLAAPTGVHVLRSLGVQTVRTHNADLAAQGQRVVATAVTQLRGSSGDRLLDLARDGQLGSDVVSMRVVPLPGVAPDLESVAALRSRLAGEHHVEVAASVWGGRALLRLSAQIYNRVEDYERLARALRLVLA